MGDFGNESFRCQSQSFCNWQKLQYVTVASHLNQDRNSSVKKSLSFQPSGTVAKQNHKAPFVN